ncbi:MAG: branched-chain amino acid ABC transporter permease [Proteobacteria bacterium]|nr:branched-chain amino acid ABC transporter permease [Pseudomonadota bacterium]
MGKRNWIGLAVLAFFALVFPVVAFKTASSHYLGVVTNIGVYALITMGLSLLLGYTGQISLGHAAFFGIGAYTSLLTMHHLQPMLMLNYPLELYKGVFGLFPDFISRPIFNPTELDLFTNVTLGQLLPAVTPPAGYQTTLHPALVSLLPWLSIPFGILISVVVAYAVAYPSLKLRGHYLAMATLGFGIIITTVFKGAGIFGGSDGVLLEGSRGAFLAMWDGVAAWAMGLFGAKQPALTVSAVGQYYVIWPCVLLVLIFCLNLIHSRVGRSMRSIHGSELAAGAMGVNVARTKVNVFVLSAIIASFAGSLFCLLSNSFKPDQAGFAHSIEFVVMVIIGGMASIWGAILGTGALVMLPKLLEAATREHSFLSWVVCDFLRLVPDPNDAVQRFAGSVFPEWLGYKSWGLLPSATEVFHKWIEGINLPDWKVFLFGLALMLIMMILPGGLISAPGQLRQGFREKDLASRTKGVALLALVGLLFFPLLRLITPFVSLFLPLKLDVIMGVYFLICCLLVIAALIMGLMLLVRALSGRGPKAPAVVAAETGGGE